MNDNASRTAEFMALFRAMENAYPRERRLFEDRFVRIRYIGAVAPGSRILFTYVHKDVLDHPEIFLKTKNLNKTLSNAGEPWTFGFLQSCAGYCE